MKITMSVREVMDRHLWDEVCDHDGITLGLLTKG